MQFSSLFAQIWSYFIVAADFVPFINLVGDIYCLLASANTRTVDEIALKLSVQSSGKSVLITSHWENFFCKRKKTELG